MSTNIAAKCRRGEQLASLIFLVIAACGVKVEDSASTATSETESRVMRSITRDTLVGLFGSIAKNDWDVTQPMAWSYFFTDPDPEALDRAGRRLESDGYEVVGLLEPEEPDEQFYLHVRRIESHSIDSLLARNEDLYDLADEFGLDSYDGMDVGPVELDPDLNR